MSKAASLAAAIGAKTGLQTLWNTYRALTKKFKLSGAAQGIMLAWGEHLNTFENKESVAFPLRVRASAASSYDFEPVDSTNELDVLSTLLDLHKNSLGQKIKRFEHYMQLRKQRFLNLESQVPTDTTWIGPNELLEKIFHWLLNYFVRGLLRNVERRDKEGRIYCFWESVCYKSSLVPTAPKKQRDNNTSREMIRCVLKS